MTGLEKCRVERIVYEGTVIQSRRRVRGEGPEAAETIAQRFEHSIEECSQLKSKLLLLLLAGVAASWTPQFAAGQVAPEKPRSMGGPPAYKWEAFGGFAYTSLNQVNLSRYGLMGARFGVTRDFSKHFGLTGLGGYWKPPTGSGGGGNPGDPSVYSLLAGPEFRANLYGNFDGFVHGLLGVEHTGGEHMTPNLSFAGGFGGGMVYNMSPRWALRASGDRVGASFSLANNTSELGYSPHVHWNARGEVGVIYRF